MERVKAQQLERAATERIIADVTAYEAVSGVFTDPQQRAAFVRGLVSLGDGVSLGGRTLREKLLGCTTFDFASTVQLNALDVAGQLNPDTVRTYWTLSNLAKFPTERMVRDDLDFTLGDQEIEAVSRVFSPLGFNTKTIRADNGVRIVEVNGDNGVATFALESESWHTRPPWPKIGTIHAPLVVDGEQPSFHLDTGWGSLYCYPFVCPGMGLGELRNPMHPRNVAAAGRALLGTFTIAAPDPDENVGGRQGLNYKMLPLPVDRNALCEVVAKFVLLVEKIRLGELREDVYRSGIRDLSLALFEITLKWEGWDAARGDNFYSQIHSAYLGGCLN